MEASQNSQKFRAGTCTKVVPVPQVSWQGRTELTKVRVRVWMSYTLNRSSHRNFGHGYGSYTELTEIPGRYTKVVPFPRVL